MFEKQKCTEEDEIRVRKFIGYAERSLIYLIFLMAHFGGLELADTLNSLSLIIAGKGLFRISDRKERAELYILGTFLSIFLGTLITWLGLIVLSVLFTW